MKVGILYSQDVYAFGPDPVFPDRTVSSIIEDLRLKLLLFDKSVDLIEEDQIVSVSFSEYSVLYTFPLLGYVDRDPKLLAALELLEAKSLFFNSYQSLVSAASKYSTADVFARHRVASPETLITRNSHEAIRFVADKQTVIVKPDVGSESVGVTVLSWDTSSSSPVVQIQGEGVRNVVFAEMERRDTSLCYHNRADALVFTKPFFLQEYIRTDTLLKVYVIEASAVFGLTIQRVGVESSEVNILSHFDIGRGAVQKLLSQDMLPPPAAKLACDATVAFGLRSGLVDLIYCGVRKEWLVLEVNNDDFSKIRDRSERLDKEYTGNEQFDWNMKLAKSLAGIQGNVIN